MKLVILIVAVAAIAAPAALACGDEGAENLLATPAVKAGLTAAYTAAHPSTRVGGPAPGRTWYGRIAGYEFAVATFGAHPTVFSRPPGSRWKLERDTHGAVCASLVPVALLVGEWSYRHWARQCYLEPR
ncbi:MAG TPA: hypothetical protein VGJ77_00825 [Gaiellaceae bacterium]|jgi:hypothetical protein